MDEQLNEGVMDSVKNALKNYKLYLAMIFGPSIKQMTLADAKLTAMSWTNDWYKKYVAPVPILNQEIKPFVDSTLDSIRNAKTVDDAYEIANHLIRQWPEIEDAVYLKTLYQVDPEKYHQEIIRRQNADKDQLKEKQDACYRKVKSRYKVWPSAYASGALVQCRKKGAANWGTGGKKK